MGRRPCTTQAIEEAMRYFGDGWEGEKIKDSLERKREAFTGKWGKKARETFTNWKKKRNGNMGE